MFRSKGWISKWKENKRKAEERRVEKLKITFESGKEGQKVIMVGATENQTQDDQKETKWNEKQMKNSKSTYY